MLVDEVFALYLYHWSRLTNEHYYQIVLYFVIVYRECLNNYGWDKKYGQSSSLKGNERIRNQCAFCLNNNAEYAPSVCNEYI